MQAVAPEPPSHEITPESVYVRRREFIKNGARVLGLPSPSARVSPGWSAPRRPRMRPRPRRSQQRPACRPRAPSYPVPDEPQTPFQSVTTYNNFYEFGLDKDQPARNAHTLVTRPWTVEVAGEVPSRAPSPSMTSCSWFPLEERVYRMRCVEAWSMVIPWLGFPLGDLIKRLEPTGNAASSSSQRLLDPKQMPGQRDPVLASGPTWKGCGSTRPCIR